VETGAIFYQRALGTRVEPNQAKPPDLGPFPGFLNTPFGFFYPSPPSGAMNIPKAVLAKRGKIPVFCLTAPGSRTIPDWNLYSENTRFGPKDAPPEPPAASGPRGQFCWCLPPAPQRKTYPSHPPSIARLLPPRPPTTQAPVALPPAARATSFALSPAPVALLLPPLLRPPLLPLHSTACYASPCIAQCTTQHCLREPAAARGSTSDEPEATASPGVLCHYYIYYSLPVLVLSA
jgi:hypothetical protein